jgi:hypothetical protein
MYENGHYDTNIIFAWVPSEWVIYLATPKTKCNRKYPQITTMVGRFLTSPVSFYSEIAVLVNGPLATRK